MPPAAAAFVAAQRENARAAMFRRIQYDTLNEMKGELLTDSG